MAGNYYMNLEKISLDNYQHQLENTDMLPSRRILKEEISKRFCSLKKCGIKNLQNLVEALKNPDKVKEFSELSGLPEDYLLIMRREINSFQPKPVNLKEFPGVSPQDITKLKSLGVGNTMQLFDKVKTKKERDELAKKLGLKRDALLDLVKLTDLSRVKWIGPIFARIFLDSGVDTAEKVAKAKAEILFKKLMEINNRKKYTKGRFTLKDIELCISVAKDVPKEIKY